MRRRFLAAALWIAAIAAASAGGVSAPPMSVDMSGYATQSAMQSAVSAVQSQIPQPAASVPPMETPGGSPGTAGTYRPGNAVQPRITRTKTVTLDAAGTATFDWTAQGALTVPVQVVLGPVYTGTGAPKCWVTAASATAASIKCVVENTAAITLSVVTAGLTLNGSAAGIQVGVVVLPTS